MSDSYVTTDKRMTLAKRMGSLGIREDDIAETFILGSGAGGQKINKTSSCVRLVHRGSGIEVRCQQMRSREVNRYLARCELCDRLESRLRGLHATRQQAIEKIRRQKRRRSRRQKERVLREKKLHSVKKQSRRERGHDD